MKIQLRSTLGLSTLCATLLTGCFSGEAPVERSTEGRVQVKISPIDLDRLKEEPGQLARVLSMPFVELAERLPPFIFECEAEMTFTQGSKSFRQLDQHRYAEDESRNFHATMRSAGTKEINVWLKDGEILVRQGSGKIRRTPRRDIEIEKWGELALSPKRHSFELFYPYLSAEPKGDEEFQGRTVRRYALGLRESPGALQQSYKLPRAETRLAPVAGWREQAKPIDVDGYILVDTELKVVLQSSFRGRLKLNGATDGEAESELTLRFESTILDNTNPISTDDLHHIIDEVSRARPKKGNLGFYDPPSEPSE